MGYRFQTGAVAWLIHRGTGIALTLYLFVHLYVLSHLKTPEKYSVLMGLMKNPVVKLAEAGLLALVIAHALNGIRVTLVELGLPTSRQKTAFHLALALGVILFLAGAWPLLMGAP